MARSVYRLLVLTAATASAIFIAVQPGRATLEWRHWRLDADTGVLVLATVALVLLVVAMITLWRALWHTPQRWARAWRQRRHEAGEQALSNGQIAVVAGDGATAVRETRLTGRESEAARILTALHHSADGALSGLLGLLDQAMAAGDRATALKRAQEAVALRPAARGPLLTLLALQSDSGDLEGALRSVETAARIGALSALEARRRKARLLMAKQQRALTAGENDAALADAAEAARLDPELAAASAAYARLLAAAGQRRAAEKLLLKAWRKHPAPVLASAWMANDDGDDAAARFRRLEAVSSDQPAATLALAHAAIEARLWDWARPRLGALAAADAPTATVCRLMAALEEGEHSDWKAACQWLKRAAAATAGTDSGDEAMPEPRAVGALPRLGTKGRRIEG